jgi:hypothetical protein
VPSASGIEIETFEYVAAWVQPSMSNPLPKEKAGEPVTLKMFAPLATALPVRQTSNPAILKFTFSSYSRRTSC